MATEHDCLYYVYDPMCSWCWGYQPTLQLITQALAEHHIPFTKVLGGLAPDSDSAMPNEMQAAIQGYWHKIHDLLGTPFNHDFWSQNTPRRSTYPACRAVLIARQRGLEDQMNQAIQHAYYLHARNPSDHRVLVDLAGQLGMDTEKFSESLNSAQTHTELLNELALARAIGGNSFPSWILQQGEHCTSLMIDYKKPDGIIDAALRAFSRP